MGNIPAFLLDLETEFITPMAGLQPSPLGKGACVAVIIQNRLSNIDHPITGNALTLMIGKRTGQSYERLPGTETPVIYVKDLEEVYVRTQAAVGGISSVNFTVIVYRDSQTRKLR
jgi:hypothetical protein